MKRFISIFLTIIMVFSLTTVAFARTGMKIERNCRTWDLDSTTTKMLTSIVDSLGSNSKINEDYMNRCRYEATKIANTLESKKLFKSKEVKKYLEKTYTKKQRSNPNEAANYIVFEVFETGERFYNIVLQEVNVNIKGKRMTNQYGKSYIDTSNRTMVPLRAFGESANCTVEWNESDSTIKITPNYKNSNDAYITFYLNYCKYTVTSKNGNTRTVKTDALPKLENGRTWVPVRFAAEALYYNVSYDANKKLVSCN